MTVTYKDTSFLRLLFKWKGSIWKSIWKELAIFLAAYFAINLSYRLAMTQKQKKEFEAVVHFVYKWIGFIPIQFLLSFFVSYIVGRWWDQLMNIGWPDRFLTFLTANLPGMEREHRIIRRTIARWTMLHAILVWKEISVKVKKRFPTDDHLLKAGLFNQREFDLYKNTSSTYGRWFAPVSWIVNKLAKLNQKGIISDIGLQQLVTEIYAFRTANAMLTVYDWINAPLRYTQVTTFATYGYFVLCLIGRQGVAKDFGERHFDIYFPIVTILEFIFYVGWLKVAEEYRVPFGEDDDDFDMNYILDRNIHVGNMIVDELAGQSPKECEDNFFNDKFPVLPHTQASDGSRDKIPAWRLSEFVVEDDKSEFLDDKIVEHNLDPTRAQKIMKRGPFKFVPRKSHVREQAEEHKGGVDVEGNGQKLLARRKSDPVDLETLDESEPLVVEGAEGAEYLPQITPDFPSERFDFHTSSEKR